MENMDRIIALIYGTVLDPERWPVVLRGLAEGMECVDASLIVGIRGEDGPRGNFGAVGGTVFHDELMPKYLSHYVRWDPFYAAIPAAPAGTIVQSDALISPGKLSRNPFFQELLIPNGGRHYGGWVLRNDESKMIGVTVHRPDAPLDSALLEKWLGVARHLGHAAELSARLAPRLTAAEGFRRALDHHDISCMLADQTARVVDASVNAAASLADGGILRVGMDGRLLVGTDEETARLHSLIAAACTGQRGGRLRTKSARGQSMIIEVIPTGIMTKNPFLGHAGGLAMLFFTRQEAPTRPDTGQIRRRLGCTLAEAEVAAMLAAALTPRVIAEARGTSLHTVRAQIRALLQITGTNSVAQLVAYLA